MKTLEVLKISDLRSQLMQRRGRHERTSVDSASEDPSSGGHSGFDQTLAEHLLEFGLQFKVLEASVNRDEQFGKLQLPLFSHEVQQQVGFGVIRHAHVLTNHKTQT